MKPLTLVSRLWDLRPDRQMLSFLFQRELTRRRENKAKAELAGKTDRVMQLRQEIAENERQLDMAQVRRQISKNVAIKSSAGKL